MEQTTCTLIKECTDTSEYYSRFSKSMYNNLYSQIGKNRSENCLSLN